MTVQRDVGNAVASTPPTRRRAAGRRMGKRLGARRRAAGRRMGKRRGEEGTGTPGAGAVGRRRCRA
uniref:Uncharacterized protein n=1 Tax=Oryza nivara TaxID=4536 RepID=A0A0E0IBA9_ORYNI